MTTRQQGNWQVIGDERTNQAVLQTIVRQSPNGTIRYVSTFDHGQKVMALTETAAMVASNDGVMRRYSYQYYRFGADGRTFVITRTGGGRSYRHQMRSDEIVAQLLAAVDKLKSGSGTARRRNDPSPAPQSRRQRPGASRQRNNRAGDEPDAPIGDEAGIAERVRFWEEQDRINRELIPRVIRQHELLAQHIGEHDNLPALVAQAIAQALADMRAEMAQQYTVAVAEAKSELGKQAQTDLEQAVSTVKREARRTRNLLIGIATAGVAMGLAAVIISIIAG